MKLLNAHCATNGRSTEHLKIVTRILRPPRKPSPATGLLGYMDVAQQTDVCRTLSRDGFYIFPNRFSREICDELHRYAGQAEAVIEPAPGRNSPPLARYDRACPISRTYRLREKDSICNPAVQRLMADELFLAIAESYLNTYPVIGGVDVWWSAPYGDEPGSEAAQLFHFDFDAPPAWLKLFVYVTDVDAAHGPHVYVRGSHRSGTAAAQRLRARGYERIPDRDVAAAFGADSIVEITGGPGTVFFADTRGFHKGKMPIEGDRLVAQLLYCSPIFADHGMPAKLPREIHPALMSAMAKSPRAYQRFR